MEKVKVTRDQEKAIKQAIELHGEDYVVDSHCLKQKNGLQWNLGLDALNDFEMWQLAKAIYIGYEIEPEFKEKDWVVVTFELHSSFGQIKQITKVSKSHALGNDVYFELDGGGCYYPNEIKHSTPEEIKQEKERRFWKDLGREVNEYRQRDIIKLKQGWVVEIRSVNKSEFHSYRFTNHQDQDDGVTKEGIRELICPAENRLDLSN